MPSKLGRKIFVFDASAASMQRINFNLGSTRVARLSSLAIVSNISNVNVPQAAWLSPPSMIFQLQRSDPGWLVGVTDKDYIDSVKIQEKTVIYDPVANVYRYTMPHEERSLSDNGILVPDNIFVGFEPDVIAGGSALCIINYTVVSISELEKIALSS